MPRPLEREKPLQRVNIMLDCEALENAQRAAALVGVDPSIVGSNSAFIRWLIDRYNEQASEENLQLSKISEIKEFVLSGGEKQLRMQKLKAQAELFEATYGKKRAKKLIDKMKNHNRFFEGLSDIPKASHKGERDDAIQAARVGMKMAEVVINDDDKARAALRSIPEHAVKMAQSCAEAERDIIDEFGIKPLIETRELIKKRMKK